MIHYKLVLVQLLMFHMEVSFENSSQGSMCGKMPRGKYLGWEPNCRFSKPQPVGTKCKGMCLRTGVEIEGDDTMTCGPDQKWRDEKNETNAPKCTTPLQSVLRYHSNFKQEYLKKNLKLIIYVSQENAQEGIEYGTLPLKFIQRSLFAFPIDRNKLGGLILFSKTARTIVQADEINTCYFYKALAEVNIFDKGSRYTGAIQEAYRWVKTRLKGNGTALIVFVTNRQNTDNDRWLEIAETIKSQGHLIFTFGIGKVDKKKLMQAASKGRDKLPLFFYFSSPLSIEAFTLLLKDKFNDFTGSDCPYTWTNFVVKQKPEDEEEEEGDEGSEEEEEEEDE